ncbi:MAG: neutral/alkaline non-lysosomal ceramidase N-terminal domain-containing protein [Planctomycetes bacterium]|nr:neutral/alkaline non-lysosomal ceramidase N-terminal domain-containing protein [Planctomycetota bacterium]
MELGFAKTDITPRVGVELCGFGAFINRHSVGVRDRLWARAMAVQVDEKPVVIVACDLIGVKLSITQKVRVLLADRTGLEPDRLMICCSHTHSGPSVGTYIGWGESDPPYEEVLPYRIADAVGRALNNLQEARLCHAEVPCEGIGINREYDDFWADYGGAMQNDWRPSKPELTDTTCHVLSGRTVDGELLGFGVYFGCHPVVCCSQSCVIHGDYPGVALNNVERDHPGAVGLFFQGAHGDVNTAIGGRSQQESLLALDEIAGRFARSVREGIAQGQEIDVHCLQAARHEVTFIRKTWDADELKKRLVEAEQEIAESQDGKLPDDADRSTRMNTVNAIALRGLLKRLEDGDSLSPPTELHGIRLGPIAILGSPFETFQAIKRDVAEESSAPIPFVTSLVNDSVGYAPDETKAQEGGYAADTVPMICGQLPFADVHQELVEKLLELDLVVRSI